MSCKYFHRVFAIDEMKLMAVELQFIYVVFHTKMLVIFNGCSYILRFIAFTNVVMAFILFNRLKKHQLPKLDVELIPFFQRDCS